MCSGRKYGGVGNRGLIGLAEHFLALKVIAQAAYCLGFLWQEVSICIQEFQGQLANQGL
jgi:hypothetical protein